MSVKIEEIKEQLYSISEKAEIVQGEIVKMSPTGGKPGRAGGKIYTSLDRYEQQTQRGYAFPDNVGFIVNLPNRGSFSPDAAFYTGQAITEDFLVGAPIFAVEVRSKNDYGEKADQKILEKILDYFTAGTLIVWDVDVIKTETIKVYRATDPLNATVYHRGEIAEAEPALPGWTFPVDSLFL